MALYGSFDEKAQEAWDFARCQRPDGSTYGTSGKCRKGVEIEKIETGYFRVRNAEGQTVGTIMAEGAFVGGGGIKESGRQAKYTVTVKGDKRNGLTLAAAKTQAKEWLGEKTGGVAKVQVQGGLSAKGKAKRVANQEEKVEELRDEFNSKASKWKSMGPEQRRADQGMAKNLKWLKERYEEELSLLKTLQDAPVVD
jgi:hypothetical protein